MSSFYCLMKFKILPCPISKTGHNNSVHLIELYNRLRNYLNRTLLMIRF